MKPRTDQEIVDQTNKLARAFYKMLGNEVCEGYRFDKARHPQERLCWAMAAAAQEELTDTDAQDALSNVA